MVSFVYLLKPVFHDSLQKTRFFSKKPKNMISRMRRSYVWKRRSYPCQVFIIFLDQDVISQHRSLTVGSEMAAELGSRVFSSETLVKGAG